MSGKRNKRLTKVIVRILYSFVILLFLVAIVVSNLRNHPYVGTLPLTIELRIEDITTGNAIPDALVEVAPPFTRVMTDSEGKCQITQNIQAVGSYWGPDRMFFSSHRSLRVTADGYNQWRKQFVEIFGPTYHFKGEPGPLSYTIRLKKDDSTAEVQ